MGTIFEELIRKFNEALDENPGEHFTPREVVRLMVDLMLAGDENEIRAKKAIRTVYDPCCGSGGMLTITKEHITVGLRKNGDLTPARDQQGRRHPPVRPGGEPETCAVSKSDLFMKDPTAATPTTSRSAACCPTTATPASTFDYLIANPPYGKDWKLDEDAVRAEHERGAAGRFAPGCRGSATASSCSSAHARPHAKEPNEGGSPRRIIMNGSPLFTGDAGSGESEIRRWILENDCSKR